jgi:hypothetical protein
MSPVGTAPAAGACESVRTWWLDNRRFGKRSVSPYTMCRSPYTRFSRRWCKATCADWHGEHQYTSSMHMPPFRENVGTCGHSC